MKPFFLGHHLSLALFFELGFRLSVTLGLSDWSLSCLFLAVLFLRRLFLSELSHMGSYAVSRDAHGSNREMKNLIVQSRMFATREVPVLIEGETGTGKELFARAIHESSTRKDGLFVPVNCGAIPKDVFEAEFFGHKKGSFTGAFSDKQGLFEAANGGTLFLDEIAELPQDLQVKLLRSIQEKTVRPVGEVAERQIDVRLISATHKNLLEMIENRQFREDLYYRVNVIPINPPSLRERPADVPELATHFIRTISENNRIPAPEISADALDLLASYHFPGNVRELENILERTLALHEGGIITEDDIELSQPEKSARMEQSNLSIAEMEGPIDEHLLQIEKQLISEALEKSAGNITQAADLLGTTFRSLRYKIKKLGITGD